MTLTDTASQTNCPERLPDVQSLEETNKLKEWKKEALFQRRIFERRCCFLWFSFHALSIWFQPELSCSTYPCEGRGDSSDWFAWKSLDCKFDTWKASVRCEWRSEPWDLQELGMIFHTDYTCVVYPCYESSYGSIGWRRQWISYHRWDTREVFLQNEFSDECSGKMK